MPQIHTRCLTILACAVLLSSLAACTNNPTFAPAIIPVTIEQTREVEVIVTVEVRVTATPAPAATATQAPSRADIKRGIQAAVDLYAQAHNDNKPDLLKQAVDQTNAPFRRLVQTRFEEFQKSMWSGKFRFDFTVTDVQPREQGFVQARIVTTGGGATDWLFRQVAGHWVLSEPTVEQVGPVKQVETEHFTFNTYPWADDVNATVIELMGNARARVLERLGQVPDEKVQVDIMPIYGLRPGDSPNAVAYYDERSRSMDPDRILIYAPHSYLYGYYDPDSGWPSDLEDILTHEYTHLTHNRSFDNAGEMAYWMTEGLAEYVSNAASDYELSMAVKEDHIIPIVDQEADLLNRQDLTHMYTLEQDTSLAYALSHSLVVHIVREYGGLDSFWKLARAYSKYNDWDKALREALGVSYEEFDHGWRAWLKQLYP